VRVAVVVDRCTVDVVRLTLEANSEVTTGAGKVELALAARRFNNHSLIAGRLASSASESKKDEGKSIHER
jgi:hypothetical protein